MLEIASQMILCLLLAALLGFIIGYLFGKMTCADDECGQTEEPHVDSHETSTSLSNATAELTENTSTHTKENLANTAIKTEDSLNNTTVDTNAKSTNDSTNHNTKTFASANLTGNGDTHTKENLTDTTIKTRDSLNNTTVDANSKSHISTNAATATTINKGDTQRGTDTHNRTLTSPRSEGKDNLSRIKGIGAKIEESLNKIGIYHFDQIAAWSSEDIAWADETLGFPGRADREKWVEQAKILSAGGDTEFSKRVDEGKVASSK